MVDYDIYSRLVAGGLSPIGACAVMGNMFCESGMKPNNVEDRCPLGDADYTFNVDNGLLLEKDFVHDKYGYGLAQWTYFSRKQELYNLVKSRGVSISDEPTQVDFCLLELKGDVWYKDYVPVGRYLVTAKDLYEAVERVCKEYEQPAVNNISPRYDAAVDFYAKFVGESAGSLSPQSFEPQPAAPDPGLESLTHCLVPVRILRKGDKGRDVYALQCALDDMGYKCGTPDGDYGQKTENAILFLQKSYGVPTTGEANTDEWQILLSKV